MNVFICNEFLNNIAILNREESHHCHKVLRKQMGDRIHLIDGKGSFYEADIVEINRKQCKARIISSRKESPLAYDLHIALAPTKNISRFEWFIEKAIEIGISEISPVIFDHSERLKINAQRIEKIALSAVKQSLSATLPKINEAEKFQHWINKIDDGQKIVAHLCDGAKHLKGIADMKGKYTIVIGPEGDFSQKELDQFKENNWTFAVLGNKRLRTETAGMAATQIISSVHFNEIA